MTTDQLEQVQNALRDAQSAASVPVPDPQLGTAILIEQNADKLVRGSYIFSAPSCPESNWGYGQQCLWPKGEPGFLCGPDGTGKTTLVQQLILKRIGIGEPSLLGFPVDSRDHRVLYLACDRPVQAVRSLRRMVTQEDIPILDERLYIWRGALPFDLGAKPDGLLHLARWAGCDSVIIDSVKDVAAELSKEETGMGLNRAVQLCCAEGVDVLGLHHPRKAQNGGAKPRTLADMYGSRWITAGAGSVMMLWGEAGDPVVEFTHLKQPSEPVGPFKVVHDHVNGTSTVADHIDAYTVVYGSAKGVTVADVAMKLYGDSGRSSREKARRQLTRLVEEDKVHREDGARGGVAGREAAMYYPISTRQLDLVA